MVNKSEWGEALFIIQTGGGEPHKIHVKGRDRWALEALIDAGKQGCTPIDTPGPRWSAYVHNLRGQDVPIETINERHDGPFAGTHARYVLACKVTRKTGRTV